MARRLRFVPPGSLVEVTCRTMQGRLLLRPSPLVADLTLGVLARAARLYPLEIHAFCFLSNHFHLLVSVESAQRLAAFMNYLNSNLAREIGRIVDWRERFWGRRYQAVLVDSEESTQVQRLVYILRQGTKEQLVRSPREWPGASSTQALLDGSVIQGTWIDRTLQYRSRRAATLVDESSLKTIERLRLKPLPAWRSLPDAEHRRRVGSLVDDVEASAESEIRRTGIEPLGVERIRRLSPHQASRRLRRSGAPLAHTATREARIRWRRCYEEFATAFWRAARQLPAAAFESLFPGGCFPPAPPFIANSG